MISYLLKTMCQNLSWRQSLLIYWWKGKSAS